MTRQLALVLALLAAAVAGGGFPVAGPSLSYAQMPSSRPVDTSHQRRERRS